MLLIGLIAAASQGKEHWSSSPVWGSPMRIPGAMSIDALGDDPRGHVCRSPHWPDNTPSASRDHQRLGLRIYLLLRWNLPFPVLPIQRLADCDQKGHGTPDNREYAPPSGTHVQTPLPAISSQSDMPHEVRQRIIHIYHPGR